MSIIDEPPPAHEQMFVGGLLRDSTAWDQLLELVDPRDISDWRCRMLYEAELAVYVTGSTVDEHSVRQRLIEAGTFAQIGGGPFLFACYDRVPNGHYVTLNANRITEAGRLRRLGIAHRMAAEKIERGEVTSSDEAIAAAAEIPHQFEAETQSPFKIVTSSELATGDYQLEYIVPHLLVKGQPCVLGAVKKCLKTTLLVALVLALASGAKFLGSFYVSRRVRVALLSGESGAATIKETAVRIAKTMPWSDLSDYNDAIWSFDLPRLGKPETVRALVKFILANAIEVLCIDPLYLALAAGDAASNLYAMGERLNDLTEVIRQTGVTIILAHHARKVGRADLHRFSPPELDDLAFAGISEWARQWLLLARRAEYNPDNGGHHELWLASGGSAGHSGLWALNIDEGTRQDANGRRWECVVSKASEARREQAEERATERDKAKVERARLKRDRERHAVLDAYAAFPDGETGRAVRDAAGLNGSQFRAINSELLKEGIVVGCQVTKNGHEYEGFRLKHSTTGTSGNDRVTSGKHPACPDGVGVVGKAPPSLEGERSHPPTRRDSEEIGAPAA